MSARFEISATEPGGADYVVQLVDDGIVVMVTPETYDKSNAEKVMEIVGQAVGRVMEKAKKP